MKAHYYEIPHLSSYSYVYMLQTKAGFECSKDRHGGKEGGLAHITPEAEPPKIDDLES